MDKTINEIIEYIAKFVDYINNFTSESMEKQIAIQKLEEAVFWLTYINSEN